MSADSFPACARCFSVPITGLASPLEILHTPDPTDLFSRKFLFQDIAQRNEIMRIQPGIIFLLFGQMDVFPNWIFDIAC